MTTEDIRQRFARIRMEPRIGVVQATDAQTGKPRYILAAIASEDGTQRIEPLGEVWDEGRTADMIGGLVLYVEGQSVGSGLTFLVPDGSQANGTEQ